MKKILCIITLAALCAALLCGCGDTVIGGPAEGGSGPGVTPTPQSGATRVVFDGSGAEITGGGASFSGGTLKISSPGSYTLSGTLESGSVLVDTGEVKGDVTITLAGADISCPDGPAIRIERAKNAFIVVEKDSFNRLCSGYEGMSVDENANGAAIFSESDLDLLGEGSLEIYGWINNGITCKDDLDIKGANTTVVAAHNGVKGSESVEISGGSITVNAGNDGIKATSVKKEGKGFVSVTGGVIGVVCGGDGISAESYLSVTGGSIAVSATGDPAAASCKGVKAKTGLTISGGVLTLDSSDHSIRCAADIEISGDATLMLRSTEGKCISAGGALTISGGRIDAESADDCVASKSSVVISGGELRILSGADGIKASDKTTGEGTIEILGGEITVSAFSDPIDAKSFARISGGSFSGVGSSKTVKGFAADSAQRSLVFNTSGAANSSAELRAESGGEVIFTVEARCGYNVAIVSVPGLAPGSYTLSCGTIVSRASVD